MTIDSNYRLVLDTTILVDFFNAVILGKEEYDNIINFYEQLLDHNLNLETTPMILLEAVKILRCRILKETGDDRFTNELKLIRRFLVRFNISVPDFGYKKIFDIRYIFPSIKNLCDRNKWDAGELSLVIDMDIDKTIFLSSDNSCFVDANLKWYDPREYLGDDLLELLENC